MLLFKTRGGREGGGRGKGRFHLPPIQHAARVGGLIGSSQILELRMVHAAAQRTLQMPKPYLLATTPGG